MWLSDTSVRRPVLATVMNLRADGHRVYLHCSDGRSRTPFIAAIYGNRLTDAPALEVLHAIQRFAPQAQPNAAFLRMIHTFV